MSENLRGGFFFDSHCSMQFSHNLLSTSCFFSSSLLVMVVVFISCHRPSDIHSCHYHPAVDRQIKYCFSGLFRNSLLFFLRCVLSVGQLPSPFLYFCHIQTYIERHRYCIANSDWLFSSLCWYSLHTYPAEDGQVELT